MSTELTEANDKINNLEENYAALMKEKENLVTQLNALPSTEEIQKTLDEKNQYILNLETQVGSLTAEKSQMEAQNGILQEHLNKVQKSNDTLITSSSRCHP